MNENQLVLISAEYANNDQYSTGTGYFVTSNLVLTSKHIFLDKVCTAVNIRLHGSGTWVSANIKPYWESKALDAVLLYVEKPIEASVKWQKKRLTENKEWYSTAYPEAFVRGDKHLSTGINGKIHFLGGSGQTLIDNLDLSVDSKPDDINKWSGISGAPVFLVGTNELIGIIQKVPSNFSSKLVGIPAYELFEESSFLSALEDDYYEVAQDTALLLTAEASDRENLSLQINSALDTIEKRIYLKELSIVEVLNDRKSFLNFLKILCKADIVFIDATYFQPGVMLAMGIRAAVKRGITIVLTTNNLLESVASLPFNLQQIKQISTNPKSYGFNYSFAIKDRIAYAITQGIEQLARTPEYLDQPAYQAIRSPAAFDSPEIKNKCLVLCPYKDDYSENNYPFIHSEISMAVSPTLNIVRMLDITSPQLVSQSLYEHIRWADQCVVDWTFWQANVFYELGVRLAATDNDPAIIIHELDIESDDLKQKSLLLKLFEPFVYNATKQKFKENSRFRQYLMHLKNAALDSGLELNDSRVVLGQVYDKVQQNYDWRQDNVEIPPHVIIKADVERRFGADRQKSGRNNVLYSANKDFNYAIQKKIKESLLTAWYYSLNTYELMEEGNAKEIAKHELNTLGQFVMLALDTPEYTSIRKQIFSWTLENDTTS